MPERFTPTIWSQTSLETSRKLRLGELMPALFTRTSMRPWRFRISAAAFATWSFCRTADTTDSAFSCRNASFSVASVRPEMTTVAPSFWNSMAPARPMPEPPPVIQATLPFNSLPLGILGRSKQGLALLVGMRPLAAALGEHLNGFLHGRTRRHLVAPALHVRKVVDVHALALRRAQPRHGRHVGDRVLVAGEPLAALQLLVQHAVQAVGFVFVAVHRVLDLLRRVAEEVVRLAEHRADVAHLRHHPLHHQPALLHVLRQELAGLGGEVKEHRARLRQHERLSFRAPRGPPHPAFFFG